MKPKASEATIAAAIVHWLEIHGLDVYQEVELWSGGPRCDIVAKCGAEITIVETKTNATLALLGQLLVRRFHAHRIYAAVRGNCGQAFEDICQLAGFGVLSAYIDPGQSPEHATIRERLKSSRFLRGRCRLAEQLRPEHKTACVAGSQTGGHWTAFRATCEAIAARVRTEPGCTVVRALEARGVWHHHYSSDGVARRTILQRVKQGLVPGVRVEAGLLYPTEIKQ